ncbi:hypothetical protein [Kutzneria kofuensis]|uniref:Uncharacterized protein n=1 Tax=Kutzneria kofuensis TaxID=103725 RepID=A0A7W9KLJ2_9PSEU|nr:hypothetical protein [Kutzneria kofuensis]MBB5894781.1 hypothetical protein [Kutzneria kofuensis]
MSDPFDLPERELPEPVRRAALRRVMTEIAHEPPRRKSGLVPLLIAASVVVLMAGATIVTTTVLGNNDHKINTAGPSATTTTSAGGRENGFDLFHAQRDWGTSEEMGRCAEADNRGNSTWVPLLRVERNNLVALLYRVGNDMVFCQLTPKTVTAKSAPYPAPPTGSVPAKILFITAEGTYAGVTAPGIDNLVIMPSNSVVGEPSAIGNGVFILPNSYKRTDTMTLRGFTVPDYGVPKADLPQPLPVSQQSGDPRGDRSSAAGQRLGDCLSGSNPPVADADWYAPGASIVVDSKDWIQVGVQGGSLVWCTSDPNAPAAYVPLAPTTHSIQWTSATKLGGANIATQLAGIASNPDAATVTVQAPGMEARTAAIDHGTFIVTGTGPPVGGSNVIVKDSNGTVLDQFTI